MKDYLKLASVIGVVFVLAFIGMELDEKCKKDRECNSERATRIQALKDEEQRREKETSGGGAFAFGYFFGRMHGR